MITQYNCFLFNEKSNIKTIVIFFPFLNDNTIIEYNSHSKYSQDDFIKKFFTTNELNNIQNNEVRPDVIYSNFPLMITDKIETLQYAILKALNVLNDVLLEELYLYAMSPLQKNVEEIFGDLTGTEYITKSELMRFLSNVEYLDSKSVLKSTNDEVYDYDKFKNLQLFKNIKREKLPLTINNDKFIYTNPFKLLEELNDKKDKSTMIQNMNFNKSVYITNRTIQECIYTEKDDTISLYGCFIDSILKIPNNSNIENIVSQYYPTIKNVSTLEQLTVFRDSNKNSRKEIIQSLFESKSILTKHLPLSLNQWENDFAKQTIFKNIRLEFQPKKNMFISLETLFHTLELSKDTSLIKYNPGARLEKYFRVYIPNTNIRKTFIQKINNELSRAKKRSVSCLIDVTIKKKKLPMIIEIRENGIIYVSLQNNVLTEDKTYESIGITLDEIEYILQNIYNKFIDYINEYYHQYDSLLPKFNNLHQNNLNILDINIIKKYKIKVNKNLFENISHYGDLVKNVFENIDMKRNDYIKFLFKHSNIIYNNKINVIFRRSSLKDKSFETIVENIYHFDLLMPIFFMFDNLLHISQERIKLKEHTIVLNSLQNNNAYKNNNNDSVMSEKNEIELLTEYFNNNDEQENNMIMTINDTANNMSKSDKLSNNQFDGIDNKSNNKVEDTQQNNQTKDLKIEEETKNNNEKDMTTKKAPKTLLGFKKRNDSNNNNDFFGGSKQKVNEKRNYTYERIKQYDPNLVKKEKENNKDYSRYCPSTDRRQPTIITESEKQDIDSEAPGSYGNDDSHILKYRKRDGENLYYICPRYWCIDKNISLRHEDVEENGGRLISSKCPTGEIISYDHPLYHYRKDDKTKYVNTYPGLNIKKSSIPCCFKKPRKDKVPNDNDNQEQDVNKDANKDIDKDFQDDNADKKEYNKTIMLAEEKRIEEKRIEQELIDSKKNTRILEYNKFPLPEFRFGILPLNVKLLLNISNNDCMGDKTNCFMRFGTFNKNNNSFVQAMNLYYVFKNDSKRITNKLKSEIIDTDKFIDDIINKMLTIDEFIYYQNGNLVEIFDYEEDTELEKNSDNNELKNAIFLKTITNNNNVIDEHMKTKVLRSYNNYKSYLRKQSFDYRYTWELFTNKLNLKDKTKTNIIIIEVDGFEVESPCRIICPVAYDKDERFNTRKPSLILIKYKDYYEPLINRRREGESKFYNKILFSSNDDILKPFLDKIENIYNDNDFCGKYMVNQEFKNQYNNFNQLSVQTMQEFFTKNNFVVKSYIVNYNTRLSGFVVSNNSIDNTDFFIPVHQTGIESLRQIKKRDYKMINTVNEYTDLYSTIEHFNFIHELDGNLHYKPKYFVCDGEYVVGIQFENTLIVPILPQIPKSSVNEEFMLDCIENSYIFIENNQVQHYDFNITHNNKKDIISNNNKILEDIVNNTKSYNNYRNHIKSNMNSISNRKIKNIVKSILVNATNNTYTTNMNQLIELLKELYLNNKDKLSLTSREYNELFPYLLSDELLRHYRIRDYIFVDNKYILFGNKEKINKENEILIAQTALDNLNDELIELTRQSHITSYNTSNSENEIALKYDDGFDILNYKVSLQKHNLFQDEKININKDTVQGKANIVNTTKTKTIKKREKCPNGTRKNKKTGLCEDK